MNELIVLMFPLAVVVLRVIAYWMGYQAGYERGLCAWRSKP